MLQDQVYNIILLRNFEEKRCPLNWFGSVLFFIQLKKYGKRVRAKLGTTGLYAPEYGKQC